MVMIETLDKREIEANQKEILRYLGYGNNEPDEKVLEKIKTLTNMMQRELSLKACYEKYPVTLEENALCFGSVKTESEALKRNLTGCREVIVFTATIGIGTDRIIGKSMAMSTVDAVICQAIGAAFIEAWCDILCKRLEKKESGKFLRPRFSPGYGDFHIDNQKEIFKMLDCPRKIGVTLTDAMQMLPSKSVSAVIGVGEENLECNTAGCELCEKEDCQYRR